MFWRKKKEIPEKSTMKEDVIPKLQSLTINAQQLYLQERLPDKFQFTEAHRAKCTFGSAVITTFVKVLKNAEDPERVKDFRDAAKSLVKLHHPNIVSFLGLVSEGSSQLIAVFEYCPGRTVLDHLIHNHIAPLSWSVRLRIGLECAQAMEYLHQNRMVYRFMCASNVILTDSDFSCKLTDFELIRPRKEDALPVRWMAPEVLKRCHFTPQSDVWAYGIFLMELFTTGRKPYSDLLDHEVVSKLTDGSLYRMEVPLHYPKQLQADIKHCWEETPEKRPSLQMLIKDITKLMIPKC